MKPRIAASWKRVFDTLNENQQRWLAAEKAREIGRGGIQRVHEVTKLSRVTIDKGIRELNDGRALRHPERIRKPGGGRRRVEPEDQPFVSALERILSETTAGDPMTPLKWTVKSMRTLSTALRRLGYKQSPTTVRRVLRRMGYSLQANRRTIEGSDHPDRDAQFRHIATQVNKHVKAGEPVISIDAKKREYIGKFKNPGRTWRKKGHPVPAYVYDYKSQAEGVAILYGLYDEQLNEGMVNVGVSHETGEFAVESIRAWWTRFGKKRYPKARRILACADGGGSNRPSNKMWQLKLQEFCDATGLIVTVCHYPPGTSKWNKIEHRMFSFISMNWKGKQLTDYETVINLIGHTVTRTGLRVSANFDDREYKTGLEVPASDMETLNLRRHAFHPNWNYTIKPRGVTGHDR